MLIVVFTVDQRRLDCVLFDNLFPGHQGSVGDQHHCAHLNPVRLERWAGRGRGLFHVLLHLSGMRHHVCVSVGRGYVMNVATMSCGLFFVSVTMCCGLLCV